MIYYVALIVVFAGIAGALTFHAIKAGGNRPALVGIFCLIVAFGMAAANDIMGLPKPLWLEWRSVENVPVIAMKNDRDARITYFWVVKDGVPRTYYIPWKSAEEAEELERRQRLSRTNGEHLVLTERDFLSEDGPQYEFQEPNVDLTK